jgi:hypothetical protein
VIPPSWLKDHLRLAAVGVQAIAGTVTVDNFEEHGPEVPERFRKSFWISPHGWHGHVHGANFGVRADCHLAAGGWADLETAEDHDLWHRLARIGAAAVSTASITVITSGRRIGRAPTVSRKFWQYNEATT